MPNPQEASIDGYGIRLWEPIAGSTSWRVEAADKLWHRYAESFGRSPTEALIALSKKTEIDQQELLRTFGL